MRIISFLFFVLFLFNSGTLRAQIEDAEYIFRELRALDGTWFMPTDRGDRLEVWTRTDDSTLTGKALRIKSEDGDTITLETMRLEWRSDSMITYYRSVRGQNQNEPVAFQLTLADEDGYLFENPINDDPKKILYRLLGNRELQVTTEGQRSNGRATKNEYVYEREFTPGTGEFRIRGGINVHTLNAKGTFPTFGGPPEFSPQVGWELGAAYVFRGKGSFLSLNLEFGLMGRGSGIVSTFADDTILYVRDGNYNTAWFMVALIPELTLGRDSRFSVMAGPYFGRLMFNQAKGTVEPGGENKLFDANEDLKKNDLGITLGLQYKLNFGKKDLGGILGLRGNVGLSNLDNLYCANSDNTAFCNGSMKFVGASLYYSVNLVKI